MRIFIIILIIIVAGISSLYLFPNKVKSFSEVYVDVDRPTRESLLEFRKDHPLRTINIDGVKWAYLSCGSGQDSIVFLHGMGGAADIWWQQILALEHRYRVLAPSYPPVEGIDRLAEGISKIMDKEDIKKATIIGTSLGGYLAQDFVRLYPEKVEKAVFANTFPPNNIIAEKSKFLGSLLPFFPEWLVMRAFRGSIINSVYPASGYSEIVKAYQLEQGYGLMSKAQFVARYHCVIDGFPAPNLASLGIKTMIIESGNDPLVEKSLREMLKQTYPTARIHTFHNTGHFTYLNKPKEYTEVLVRFLNN
ncbi:MAG: alpha/beta hydrolase [Thermodesulfobacteriota bacterium]|nr:alpha/beta hydrolase [Thermodesulfobacteriota bacterium]